MGDPKTISIWVQEPREPTSLCWQKYQCRHPVSPVPTCQVSLEYLKDTNILFIGGMMVALAVENWNLHKRIALRVLLIIGVRPAL